MTKNSPCAKNVAKNPQIVCMISISNILSPPGQFFVLSVIARECAGLSMKATLHRNA